MREDRWLRGKAAASPQSGATWASVNAASVYLRGAHQQDQAGAKDILDTRYSLRMRVGVVETTGLEPVTPALQRQCSAN
jgi:hypothetical protein